MMTSCYLETCFIAILVLNPISGVDNPLTSKALHHGIKIFFMHFLLHTCRRNEKQSSSAC